MSGSAKKVILLIEDEKVTARTVTKILEKHNYIVHHALSGSEAISIVNDTDKIDLLLTDIDLGGGMDGTIAAREILKYKNIPVLFLSSHTEPEIVEKTEKITSYGYVVKNTGETVLIASLNMAFKLFEAHEKIKTQKQELEASSEEMQASLEELEAINEDLLTTQNRLIESEKLMAETKNMLQLVLDTIPARIFWKGLDFKYLGCNRLVAMDAGKSNPDELIGLTDFDTPWKEQAVLFRADDENIIKSGQSKINYEERLTQNDGTVLWLNSTKVPLRNIEGEIIGILGTWEDITGKKKALEYLQITEERFTSIIQSSSDMIFIVDKDSTISYESPSVAKILGYPAGFFIGKSPFSLIQPDDLSNVLHEMDLVSRTLNDGLPTEFRLKKADNTWVSLEAIASNLQDNSSVKGIVITARDISERKKSEEAIRLSEEKFRNIFETMSVGYFRTSVNGNLLDLNPACLRIFGYDSIDDAKASLNDNSKNVYADHDEWLRIRKTISDKSIPSAYTVKLIRKDGSEFFGNVSLRHFNLSDGTPLHIEGLIEDITERIKTQEILIQSEKMITVAGLAAGMAHEINNPLGIIMQNAENATNRIFSDIPGNINAAVEAGTDITAVRKYAELRRINNYLQEIHDAGTRAAKIISNMLQFSRRTESKFSYINLNDILDKAIDLAMNDYDLKKKYDFRKILISKNYGVLPKVQCQETQIEQVFLNIFKNSAQAMSRKEFTGGEVPLLNIRTFSADGNTTIEIADNGPGMDESIRKKVFEPFYTTKESGSGTGLGLSVSFYIIVTGHGGTITAESTPGKGSAFIITLPETKRNI
jgi:PAS domain S-box-containing protein